MRRTLVLVASGLLVLAMAAPVSAAPSRNVLTVEIDCSSSNVSGLGVFLVDAVGLPGWPDRTISMTPIHFRATSGVEVWENGAETLYPGFEPPQGLQDSDKLVGPCEMHIYGGTHATFDVEWHDTWYFFPRPAE